MASKWDDPRCWLCRQPTQGWVCMRKHEGHEWLGKAVRSGYIENWRYNPHNHAAKKDSD